MAELRKVLSQVFSGVVVVGVWILALNLPLLVYAPNGPDAMGPVWLGVLLSVFFVAYIAKNFRNALKGARVQIGDLVAKVIVPLTIFVGMSALYFI